MSTDPADPSPRPAPTPEEVAAEITVGWVGLVTGPGGAGGRRRESAWVSIDERVVTDARRAIADALRLYGDRRAAEERERRDELLAAFKVAATALCEMNCYGRGDYHTSRCKARRALIAKYEART